MRSLVASLLEIAGIAGMAYGMWMLAPWFGVTVGGAGLVVLGFALDVPPRKGDT